MTRQNITGEFKLRQLPEGKFMSANVPGTVMEALYDNGLIPNPYDGLNEYLVREIFRNDFEYIGYIHIDSNLMKEECIDLIIHGVDTVADIWLNEQHVKSVNNMFRSFIIPCKDILHEGENTLRIVIHSPIEYVENYVPQEGKEITMVNTGTMYGSQYIRKASSMFGWDWGAQLPDMGIWKEIELRAYSDMTIEEVEITQLHNNDNVTVAVQTEVNTYHTLNHSDIEMIVKITNEYGYLQEKVSKLKSYEYTTSIKDKVEFTLENPLLWWPRGYGGQPLYQIEVVLKYEKEIIDTRQYRIGLRTVHISQEKDEWGNEFAICINGVKIFIKGANYIPEDCFYSRINRDKIEMNIKAAVFANYNCLRIWGGGYYPSDTFYDLCDEYGLLVWQDFMYACNIYDLREDFIENIKEETKENVIRLRHHASLALWCGNNELESAWVNWAGFKSHSLALRKDYLVQFEYIIPSIVKQYDREHDYWPSSPSSSGNFEKPDDEDRGDCHYWDVWHGQKPFSEYKKHYFRFCSEFGFQSFPSMKTINTFAREEDKNIFSEVMESHQKNPAANGKILYYLSETFRYPEGLDDLIYLSQVMQGMAIKFAVEHFRRNRGRCMGSLYWQLNDNWPVASWSSVDYYGRYKALHYMAKEFYSDIAGSIDRNGTRIAVWLENETFNSLDCKVIIQLKTMDLEVIDEIVVEKSLHQLSSICLCEKDYKELINGREREVFVVAYYSINHKEKHIQSEEIETFVPYKYLQLPVADVAVKIEDKESYYELDVHTNVFTPFLELEFEHYDAIFSKNYFNLTKKDNYIVQIQKEDIQQEIVSKENLQADLTCRTIRGTY